MRARLPRLSTRACRLSSTAHLSNSQDNRASAKLFADAAAEEAAEQLAGRAPRIPQAVRDSENWTGEERIEDTVLRMLVDKYKPLRTGTVRSAEEKLRDTPPAVSTPASTIDAIDAEAASRATSTAPIQTSVHFTADTPLIPAVEGHRPWHTTFKVPSHATSSVKYGAIPNPSHRALSSPELDDKARRKEREQTRRMQTGVRLTQARESMLDYKLGMRQHGHIRGPAGRPNPVSAKGWAGLVEDRIERARQAGHFNNVKGRGQPLKRTADEGNPFIGREEFLMNRIVQRQGAAPPWVEIQGELESAVVSFREVLKQSWTRRAIRMLTLAHRPSALTAFSLANVQAFRDEEWLARERAYHTVAINELNALVRKYNGLAPYAVRRPYHALDVELNRAYSDAGPDVLSGLAESARQTSNRPLAGRGLIGDNDGDGPAASDESGVGGESLRIWDVVVGWFRRRQQA
ncbi:hypothetical protein K488DRAFT_45199 [Vararia minispora EC-137]|uniref:Uncharacterized protein n=1 Tax=Vararia minispora EC-137 TaxID=1314806 RepID=A0ACB8QRX7_9AGAM|nr:hypothetical protein K488DRAFT_45199 [Vararia minispora EC-137]